MRINKFIALHTSLSRRRADEAIAEKRVKINGKLAHMGASVEENDTVLLDEVPVRAVDSDRIVLLLNKPVGYVCSKEGQGSKTIYSLLPTEYHNLKPAGRLDKDSSGLLLMSNDGDLLFELTHPSKEKPKIYEIILNKPLSSKDQGEINRGVTLSDGLSSLKITPLAKNRFEWQVVMSEGRNRQIRRTFSALGYEIVALNRTTFGDYELAKIPRGEYQIVS